MADELSGEALALANWLADPSRTIVARLAKNAITDDSDGFTLANLTEADFPGYEPFPIDAWNPQDFDDDLYGEATSGEIQFQAGTLVAPQTVYVAYLTLEEEGEDPDLLYAMVLPLPFTFGVDGAALAVSFRIASADLEGISETESQV